MSKTTYVIDGRDFATLEGFFETIGRDLIPGVAWGRNLDAFNDILRGGFGTPEGGFILRWENSEVSRERLGHLETVRQLESVSSDWHHPNRSGVGADLERARRGIGSTIFDWLVEIIAVHSAGGAEQDDGVELVLA